MKDLDHLAGMEAILSATDLKWAAQPGKIAVKDGAQALTYAEMNGRANHMARRLVAEGAQVGDFVGYLGNPGIPFVVTFWACLKAGLVFLPINSKFPPRSVAGVLRTAKARCFVSHLPVPEGAPGVVAMDPPGDEAEETLFEMPPVAGSSLCFASSTSGSTGTPKIIGHTRDSFCRVALLDAEQFGLDETTVFANAGTTWAVYILAAFAIGASVTCYDVTEGTPQDLLDWMAEEKVSFWYVYPALFRTLAEAKGALPDLKCLLLCGEAVFRRDFELFERLTSKGAMFLNVYGQQETFSAAIFRIRNGERLAHEKVPAGTPGLGNDLVILREDGTLAGPESIGEIVNRSPGVAPGYVGDPERTAKAFTRGEDGNWRFATGDLGYIDGEGVLHYVGRKDDQIKIRNVIVQPSDIEQELKPHPGVAASAVKVSYCARGLPRLACFYEGHVAPKDLKAWLAERIPAFMLPQFFVPVDALPRTATGKLQRGVLELPEGLAMADRVAPGTENETVLSDIWQQVLGHADFGTTDNFFDVGGDSLRAMELLMLINQRLGRQITLDRVILAGGTIEALGRLLEQPAERTELRELKPGRGGPHIIAGHVYGGGVTDYLEIARAMGEGVRVSGICADYSGRSRSFPVEDKAREAVGQVPTDPPPVLMGYSFGGRVAFEIAHRLGMESRIILIDPVGPFSETIFRRVGAYARYHRSKSKGLGLEEFYPGDFSYRPRPLRTKGALFITCRTSRKADIEGWKAAIDGPVEHLEMTGDHWDIVRQANAIEIAHKIQDWLAVET